MIDISDALNTIKVTAPPSKPDKEPVKRVGMLIKESNRTERYALAQPAPTSCSMDPPGAMTTGLELSLYLTKTTGTLGSTERLIATDRITNQFDDQRDPFGGGISLAYKFRAAGIFYAAPFASFDYLNAGVKHQFVGGAFSARRAISPVRQVSSSDPA
jgi:hypothetical protein